MSEKSKQVSCAYCGASESSTRDHVIPRALYPESKSNSTIQRITVPACSPCNESWMDDEPHFRNMLLISGESNPPVFDLWEGKVNRSFKEKDGLRRKRDLIKQMVQVDIDQGKRHMVYPAKDGRVMHVIRKVIRGLCYHHHLPSPVSDDQVWADIQRYQIPPAFMDEMISSHVEEDIFGYSYSAIDDADFHSSWLLTFYERTSFFGIIFKSKEARKRLEAKDNSAS